MPLSAVKPMPAYNPVRYGPGTSSIQSLYSGTGGETNAEAVKGATAFKNALGLPSYQDLFKQFGPGTQEFGNAGLASSAAADLKGNLASDRAQLAGQQRNLASARAGIVNPTGTQGFKNIMRLTNERAGQQAMTDQIAAADAASRRGYVGGYNPEQADLNRREAVAEAGYQTADEQRQANQDLFTGENALYGNEAQQYGNELGAYTNLTQTAAELPTKYLTAFSGLLGGLGGYGDIFGTAMKGAMFDEQNRQEQKARNQQPITDAQNRILSGRSAGFA